MRLLHVVHTLNPDRGGPSQSVRMFVKAHQRAGNEVEVATLDAANADFDTNIGCQVNPCGPGKSGYGYAPKLKHWLESNYPRFDGVIVNGIWQYHTLVARQVLTGRKPFGIFTHGMLDPYFQKAYPLKHLKKLAYWELCESKNLHSATTLFFTSEEEKRTAGIGFPGAKLNGVVVPYGTMGPDGDPETSRQAFYQAFPAVVGKPYLLFLGRLHPKKGCDLLLEAFAKAAPSEFHLVMAGPNDSGWQNELQTLANQLGIQNRVHWTGLLSGANKWGALYAAEAFVLPSHQENFGIAMTDAMSCRLLPLVSDQVHIAPDVAAANAALMEPDTLAGTTQLITRFIHLNSAQKEEMRDRAYRYYRSNYDLANSTTVLYEALQIP